MKRKNLIFNILLLICTIFICPTIIADDGQYVISFYAVNESLNGSINCTWNKLLTHEFSLSCNNKTFTFYKENNRIGFATNVETCLVSNKSQKLKINSLYTKINICDHFEELDSKKTLRLNYLDLYPQLYKFTDESNSFNYNNGYSGIYNASMKITYYIEIRPSEVKCTNIGTTSGETDLIYDEPIRIQATKGFHPDVYKWRYSFTDADGFPVNGYLTPYKTEDNGATIYVRGSDFLSKSTFNHLVETQRPISISLDDKESYFKPLLSNNINLTAKPSSPKIKEIIVKGPKCYGEDAEQVTIKLDRDLLKGEVVKFTLTHENGKPQIIDSISHTGDNKIIFDYKDTIKIGKWKVDIIGRYLNSEKTLTDSYSGGEGYKGTFIVNDKEPLKVKIDSTHAVRCYGEENGEILCSFQNGYGYYNYILKDTANKEIKKRTKILTDTCVIIGLSPLEYKLSISDANGCEFEYAETITIEEPDAINLSDVSYSNPTCHGYYDGSINCTTTGGNGEYIINLHNSIGDIIDKDSITMSTSTFNNHCEGYYSLSAKDTNGCTSNTTGVTLEAPEALSLSLETKNVTINGTDNGRLSASFSGGTEPYTLSFDNKELNYQFPLDDVLINSNMYAGEGTVTLLDNNECSTSATYNITEPDTISAIVKQIDFIKCFGDNTASLQIDSIAGGMGGYTIEWFEDGDFISKDTSISSLPAGEYLVFVKDSVGAVKDYVITIDEPKKINLLSSVINTACVGEASGSILLNANGGSAPYKFSLNEQYSSSGEYNQLEAGYYNISVEDENGCKTEDTEEVKTLSDINLNVTSSSPTCYNINDGTISISINNGVGPYYVRCTEDNFLQVENNLELTNLEAGSYNIEVQDALGCIKTADAILTEPTEFNIELPEKIYLCNDQSEVVNIENERITNVDWYLNNDLVHTGLKNTLTQEGVYKLDFLYDNLCHSLGEIEVDTINKKVDANFLVAAEIPINDDAHLLNITKAENYDYQEWIYPTNDAWVYGEDENSMQLVFLKEGTWNVGLISYLDKCTASQFKTVKTFIPDSNFEQEENTYLISELSIDKSPNNGKFTAKIELSDKTDIKLYLYNASNGHIIDSKETSGEKLYEIPFSVSTTAGEYILLAVAPIWQKSKWIKMIIK